MRCRNSNPTTSVLELTALWPATRQLQQLHDAGVTTVGDVLSLDAPTALYSNAGITSLVEQIDQARAALGAERAYRRRGIDTVRVRRADVEVDIDMESTELGAYLWGALVTSRRVGGYRILPFVTWEPMSADEEPAHALLFWQWLMGLRSATVAAGLTFSAYCWNAGAENQYLRRIGRAWDIVDEVEAFIGGDEWVDLYRVWDANFITGGASGLKVVAPIVGFAWEVDDPGGGSRWSCMTVHLVSAPTQTRHERGCCSITLGMSAPRVRSECGWRPSARTHPRLPLSARDRHKSGFKTRNVRFW